MPVGSSCRPTVLDQIISIGSPVLEISHRPLLLDLSARCPHRSRNRKVLTLLSAAALRLRADHEFFTWSSTSGMRPSMLLADQEFFTWSSTSGTRPSMLLADQEFLTRSSESALAVSHTQLPDYLRERCVSTCPLT